MPALLAACPALAEKAPAPKVTIDELMAPNALPDIVEGKADAPVTIVEYASMTCGHCAAFHHDVYPILKKDYIDTGKVKFILREFPLDPIATAAFMLARSLGDKRDAAVDLLFAQQKNWAFTDTPLDGLGQCRQTGRDRPGEVRGRVEGRQAARERRSPCATAPPKNSASTRRRPSLSTA